MEFGFEVCKALTTIWRNTTVLILVMMEFGFEVSIVHSTATEKASLNPCYDGIWF